MLLINSYFQYNNTYIMSSFMDEMDSGVAFIVSKLKKELASRGAKGIVGMGRKFKIMVSPLDDAEEVPNLPKTNPARKISPLRQDDDGSGSLNMSEFKKCMK